MENELEDFIRNNRKDFDRQEPDDRVLQKIKARLNKGEKNRARLISFRPVSWAVAASVVFLLGLVAFLNRQEFAGSSLSENETEFENQKKAVFDELNNSVSANRRLAGALAACRLDSTDREMVDTLVRVMTTDQNSNVRLASLDALSKFYREKYVQRQTLASLASQDDPLVKTALIEFLVEMKETSIVAELFKIVADENSSKEIKDQAYSGLLKLNRL